MTFLSFQKKKEKFVAHGNKVHVKMHATFQRSENKRKVNKIWFVF